MGMDDRDELACQQEEESLINCYNRVRMRMRDIFSWVNGNGHLLKLNVSTFNSIPTFIINNIRLCDIIIGSPRY